MLLKYFSFLTRLTIPCVATLMVLTGVAEAQTPIADQPSQDVVTSGAPPDRSTEAPPTADPLSQPPAVGGSGQSSDVRSLTQRYPAMEQLKEQTVRFSDVQRKDWAYEPISVLMQKYGCISGYPDGTFRGQQTLTRNEFAAGLESCMSRMDKMIQDRTANLVTREDLATLFRILSTIFDNNSPTAPRTAPPAPPSKNPSALPIPGSSQ